MSSFSARSCTRMLVVLGCLGCLCVTLAFASCAPSSVREAPTPSASAGATTGSTPAATASSPRSVAAFSCAAGSLPVTSSSTRTSCAVHTENGMVLVTATYTFTNPSQLVDETPLRAAGWVLAGLVNEDGPGGSGTWFLYLKQGSWISWGGSTQDGMLGVWAGVPMNGAPIGCGKTLTGASAPHGDVPLPQGTQTVAIFLIAPFCLQDVESFYATTLTAAGWAADGPFQVESASGAAVATASATFTRNGVSAHLYLTGADGTSTVISIN
jgi:hypothetical protein